MVSTDDREIADLARSLGAEVPFMRSADNSDDHATTADALGEVLWHYSNGGHLYDQACCIYPTAPFVTADRLREAYERLTERGADSVIPIVRYGFPIQRAFELQNDLVFYVSPEHAQDRSQDLMPTYHDAGQFYFFAVDRFLDTGKLVTSCTVGIEIDELEVQDIDTEQDWQLAELKYRLMQERKK
jgi:N-acylneuraminate cytidylyltransferase